MRKLYKESADSVVGRIKGMVRKVFGDRVENKCRVYASHGYYYIKGLPKGVHVGALRRYDVGGLAVRLRRLKKRAG